VVHVRGERGEPLRREPPGAQLREGSTLTLIVSKGPPLVDLPPASTIAGLDEETATRVLGTPGLELRAEFVPTESDEVDEDEVIGYEEGTPDRVPQGSTVKVLISSGAPGPEIPDMEGWDFRDARRELRGLGLEVEASPEENDEFDTGKVIRSEPEFGDHVEEGGSVMLFVSQGDGPIAVPQVIGRSVDEAREEIEAAGLEVGEVRGGGGGVISTSPFVGQEVDPGTRVDLWTW
jgi:serine/threonine-protein kinase